MNKLNLRFTLIFVITIYCCLHPTIRLNHNFFILLDIELAKDEREHYNLKVTQHFTNSFIIIKPISVNTFFLFLRNISASS